MLVWLFLYSKIDVPPLPSAATDEGFVKRPVGYASYGKFKGSGGPKNLDKNLTPLGALRELLGNQLPQRFSLVAKATAAEKGWTDDTSITAFWKYFAAVIGHGLVQYVEERDAYVAPKSSIAGLYGNEFLSLLHNFHQFQHAKQMFALTVNELETIFNCQIELLVLPGQ